MNPTKTEGMWIGSSRENKTKPFGIKWPNEPIKSLGVFYSYDQKLLREKNFIEKLDSIKKLINIWSSRGLTICGRVTIIKSLITPKFVYISSLLPTLNDLIKDLNQLLFKFFWKGVDKVTRLSVINEYEKGGFKMIDLESMVKSLRLAWLKRIFGTNNGAWKNYLQHLLERFGGLLPFHCNYDVKDSSIPSQISYELLQWWSEFREGYPSGNDWKKILWNNKEIRINKMPIYYKRFFESEIVYVNDLLFELSTVDSFNKISKKIKNTNFLVWAGLRHSIPSHLKNNSSAPPPICSTASPTLTINGKVSDVLEKKSKD